jgi:putative FmdB family regulatory protein
MPLYDYRCPEGHTKEVRHGINETPEVRCHEDIEDPVNCQLVWCGQRMTRVISGGNFILKGKGFYYTDDGPGRHHAAANAAWDADIPKGI